MMQVIHCDLKPENVMLLKPDQHRVKVCALLLHLPAEARVHT